MPKMHLVTFIAKIRFCPIKSATALKMTFLQKRNISDKKKEAAALTFFY